MTKKEKVIFERFYDDAVNSYMSYVLSHESIVPADVLGRVLLMTELRRALIPEKYESSEQ